MICAHCKTEYIKSKPNQFRYCSKECRLAANKPKPGYTKLPAFDIKCRPESKYCKACDTQKQLSEFRYKKKPNCERSYGRCRVCESNYERARAVTKREYLKGYFKANPDKRIYYPRSVIQVKSCPETGMLFISRNGNKYSTEGKKIRARKKAKRHYYLHRSPNTVKVIKCKNCETTFTNKGFNDVFCCIRCGDQYSSRIDKRMRRARMRKAGAERVDPFIVFKKHKWHCASCKQHTPRTLIGKCQPNSPELDHIIPLSKGGEHTYMNTQLLCRQCNNLKSDKIINIHHYKFQYEIFA